MKNILDTARNIKETQIENILDIVKSIPITDLDRIEINCYDYEDGTTNFEFSLCVKEHKELKVAGDYFPIIGETHAVLHTSTTSKSH